jgi:hypothetical protein
LPGCRRGSSRSTPPGSNFTLTAADLIAWTQTTLLEGDLASAEPAKLRYRLLHVAARITRGHVGYSSASTRPGPGASNSPPPSLDSTPYPSRSPDGDAL